MHAWVHSLHRLGSHGLSSRTALAPVPPAAGSRSPLHPAPGCIHRDKANVRVFGQQAVETRMQAGYRSVFSPAPGCNGGACIALAGRRSACSMTHGWAKLAEHATACQHTPSISLRPALREHLQPLLSPLATRPTGCGGTAPSHVHTQIPPALHEQLKAPLSLLLVLRVEGVPHLWGRHRGGEEGVRWPGSAARRCALAWVAPHRCCMPTTWFGNLSPLVLQAAHGDLSALVLHAANLSLPDQRSPCLTSLSLPDQHASPAGCWPRSPALPRAPPAAAAPRRSTEL